MKDKIQIDNDDGWIKFHRKMLNSAIFNAGDPHLFMLFVYLLLSVNHKQKKIIVNGKLLTLNPGQGLFSIDRIVEGITGVTRKSKKFSRLASFYYRRLKILESTQKTKNETTSKFTIITIVNWGRYQQSEEQSNNNRITSEKQAKTNKNDKNVKNNTKKEINKEKPAKIKFGDFVKLTKEEYNKLLKKFGADQTLWMINKLDNQIGSKIENNKPSPYKSDYRAILSWVVDSYEKTHYYKFPKKKKGDLSDLIPQSRWDNEEISEDEEKEE